jgi:segregation and condensation protein A
LLELKSLKLLPREAAADPEVAALLEERDRLLHRLVGYATFKAAAAAVGEALARGEGFFVRTAGIPEELAVRVPDPVGPIDPARLAELATRLFTRRPAGAVDTSFVAPVRVSLTDAIQWLSGEIRTRGKASFTELCRSIARIEVVVRFLALLELARYDRVDLEQERPFGEIVIRWREPFSGAEADGSA